MNHNSGPIRSIFLVGFMGAGKTSVGQALAERLGWPFEDLDHLVQGRTGRTVEEIFQSSGEAEFRRHEALALREVLDERESGPRIVALGGGAFVQAENFKLLKEAGARSILLTAPVEELYRRCQNQNVQRPLRQQEDQFRKLYEAREAIYQQSTFQIETADKEISVIAKEIIERLNPPTGSRELDFFRGVKE